MSICLLLSGCGARHGALKALKGIKEIQLRRDAAVFYKNIFAEHQKTMVPVNASYWSWTFKQLNPDRITAYPDGFALCFEVKGDSEEGIFVVPLGMDVEPKPTRTASYEKLSEGIYWYSFKP